MMNVDVALNKPTVMRALTGLTPEEFRVLLSSFIEVWQESTQKTMEGRSRQRAPGGGRTGELLRAEDKLFFILVYLRLYPTQEVMGALFGFLQAQANKWIMRLTPLLREALRRQKALPKRETDGLGASLAPRPGWRVILDGTDRPVRRPKNPEKQRRYYNGRKKRHTVKNLVLTQRRKVRYLSPTVPGRRAEKPLAKPLEQTVLPKNKAMITDKGFQGVRIRNSVLVQPEKKKRGKPQSSQARHWNRLVARIRVEVEHVIAGLKRCRIVSDLFRHMKKGFDDLVMEIACGLHNFREKHRAVPASATS